MSPLLAQMDDRAADVLDDRGLDALGRLVEDEEFRPRHQGAGDGELLLLAAGEIAAAPAEHVGEHGKERENLVVDDALVARARGEAGHQILAHGQKREDLAPLRHVAEAGLARADGSAAALMSSPFQRIAPEAIMCWPTMARSSEDFPTPLRPSTQRIRPVSAFSDTRPQRLRRAVEEIDAFDAQHGEPRRFVTCLNGSRRKPSCG